MMWRLPNRRKKAAARDAAVPAARYGFDAAAGDAIAAQVEARYLPADASRRERAAFRAALHWDELLLARACARGNADAWEEFLRRYRERLHAAARGIAREAAAAADLADSLFADLYGLRLRDGERISKLDSYMGLGSLEGWLVTLLAQAHVDHWRRQRREVSLDQSEHLHAVLATPAAGADPLASGRAERALAAALAATAPEKRLLLSLYFLDGQTLGQIGRLLRVHESTVSRRLHGALLGVRRRVLREMGAGADLGFDPLGLHVDLRQYLAAGAAPVSGVMEDRP